ALLEKIRFDSIADIQLRHLFRSDSEFPDMPPKRSADALERPRACLGKRLLLDLTKPQGKRAVLVFLRRPFPHDGARGHVDHRDRHPSAVLEEDLSHSDFSAD